ncbi:hypothetical protein JAAARDRAFT_37710 [Jaapia argillacea MUCL 33604]|uniref:RRM domain-containing protein n=1 Tax=Jaapia argillacea MUCL 33604 TaxID=933084 RepID=A0A067PJU6_9AGAM|nr:hypothetical protein JAAARDRAFT_37710 [Jaapia argillacea MUCL 33604]
MDRSLDEMIKAKKVANKGARAPRRAAASRRSSGVKQQLLGKAPAASPANKARKASGTTPAKPTAAAPVQVADKIIVSNLPLDVSEQQIKELFHQTVGPLRSVQLHFDSAGRSKGIAAVQFVKQGDGPKAFQQYNNRLIDGS